MCEEDQLRVGKTGDYFQAAGESDSNDDDDDDDSDDDDDEDDFHLARRHRLRDDEVNRNVVLILSLIFFLGSRFRR